MDDKKYATDLHGLNTMRMHANALGIIPIYSEQNIFETLVEGHSPLKVLGGGSNILLTKDQDAYILKNEIKGIHIIEEDDQKALISVGAGENWHNFVLWAISNNLGGIENLALIPGCVGAAPMQNIGAYGVEQDSVFHSLKAIHLTEGNSRTFYKDECKFGYRESIFKNELTGQYIITHVNYLLEKTHVLNTKYGAIDQQLAEMGVVNPGILDIANAVISIRSSKLPDPKIIPNTGSFFKNPVVPKIELTRLLLEFPDIVSYPVDEHFVKIPAAWMIERAGYKGKQIGDAGTHKNHALVLVNYGNASGEEMLNFAKMIQNAVEEKFKIIIEPEVNIW